jgi:hypothetical protein
MPETPVRLYLGLEDPRIPAEEVPLLPESPPLRRKSRSAKERNKMTWEDKIEQLTRYEVGSSVTSLEDEREVDKDGEWVRYSDVEAFLRSLTQGDF